MTVAVSGRRVWVVFKKRPWEKIGMLLWTVGSVAFIGSAIRGDDPYALAGSILFFVGIAVFSVPLFRN